MKGGTCALQRKAKSVVQSVISSLTSGRRSVTANDNESQNLGITANRLTDVGQRSGCPRLILIFSRHTLKAMEVDFTPDLQAKLTRLAAEQGRDTKAIVREAVERFVDYDEWFLREVGKGLAAADRGEFVEHDDIGKLIDSRYPG